MPSIKELKDEINSVAHELINECYMFKHFHPSKEEKATKVISNVIRMRGDLIYRVNHPDSKDDPKALKSHYKKILDDLEKMIHLKDELGKQK